MSRNHDSHATRRRILKTGLAAGSLAALGPWPWSSQPARAAFVPGVTLDPASIPQFVEP